MEKYREGSEAGVGVSALNSAPPLPQPTSWSYHVGSPELEVSSSAKVRGQLLDEGKEHGLGEWAGWLPKNLAWVHSFTHIQHQVQVSSCQGLGKKQCL